MRGGENDGCALMERHGRAHRHRPYPSPSYFSTHPTQTKEPFTCNPPKGNQPPLPIPTKPRGVPLPIVHSIAHANHTRCALTHCTFDSSKPRGASLPHRGYTFESAGLASVTQPTLGNDVSEEATPLGVVLFLITHHYHMRRMDYS